MGTPATPNDLLRSISLGSFDDSDEDDVTSETVDRDKENYTKICQLLNIPVVTSFLDNISKQCFNIAHRGIGEKAITGITISLKSNTIITDLNFTDNNLSVDGAILIGDIFKENCFIKRLNVSCNRMGSTGVAALLTRLARSKELEYLNVSDNQITDKASKDIGRFLTRNKSIKEFDLSKNNLSDKSGKGMRRGLECSVSLAVLHLNWNHIRLHSSIEIAASLALNTSLRKLDLSWNGYDDDGAVAIGDSLLTNKTLKEIDLSRNRITTRGAKGIANGLLTNRKLEILRLRQNNIKPDGIETILDSCLENKRIALHTIDFGGVWVSEQNKTTIELLQSKIPTLNVPVGGYIVTLSTNPGAEEICEEVIEILKDYLDENRIRIVDLFNAWDADRSISLTRSEFRKGIKSCKLPVTNSHLDVLIQRLDGNSDDIIQYKEFAALLGAISF